jgi:hypothetical protein
MKTCCVAALFLATLASLAAAGEKVDCSTLESNSRSNPKNAADIHVRPDGPIRTLAKAQREARQRKATVVVHSGTYYLPETLVLTAADSGTAYVAAPGEKPVLSGGVKLDLQWQPYQDGIMQAKTPPGLTFDQLFVNGRQQPLARYPNYDPKVVIYNGYAADAIGLERVKRWADPAGGFIHALHPGRWGSFDFRITGKDATGNLAFEGGWQINRANGMHKEYRFVENIFEELDAPGEWYLNAKTSTLYFYPPAGVDLKTATVEVPRLRSLVEFQGDEKNPVQNITLRGLTLRHATRTFMETRVPLLRSDWTIARVGALVLQGTENCRIEDCALEHLGGNAIFVNMYNRRVTIQGCHIREIGASGVCFVGDTHAQRSPKFMPPRRAGSYGPLPEDIEAAGGPLSGKAGNDDMDRTPGPKTSSYPADCLVADCLIHDTGRVEKQTAGVEIDLAQRITVRHCSIYGSARAGVNIGCGSWGGHVIEFCDVFDTVLETHDHGAFNSWGRDRWYQRAGPEWANSMLARWPDLPFADACEPTILRNTRWRCDNGWDIDLDDASSNYRIYNNLCLSGGIKNPDGYRRTVENNITVNSSLTAHKWFNDNSENVFRRNIVFAPYRTGRFVKGLPGREMDYNLLDAPGQATAPAVALQEISGLDSHSLVGDAMFVDPAKGDYTVKDGSPALSLGFKNFPMDQFGVQKPELKRVARTPEMPVPGVKQKEPSRRDPQIVAWQGAKIKNIIGLDEVSIAGLNDETGVKLVEVPADSPAAKAGLRAGDVILKCNGKRTDSVADLLKLWKKVPGVAKLDVWRDQRSMPIMVEATEHQ